MINISKDKNLLDIDMIHTFLVKAYWSIGRTKEDVEKSIKHSLCFGMYKDQKQIGFARVCTDYTVFAYLMDVFILPEHRGNGYSKQLINVILEEPSLEKLKGWMLKTRDAQSLYQQFGFSIVAYPDNVMEKF